MLRDRVKLRAVAALATCLTLVPGVAVAAPGGGGKKPPTTQPSDIAFTLLAQPAETITPSGAVQLAYPFRVTNNGPGTGRLVYVDTFLGVGPRTAVADATFSWSVPTECVGTPNVDDNSFSLYCEFPELRAGATRDFQVVVDLCATTPITVSFSGRSDPVHTADPNGDNNKATSATTVIPAQPSTCI